MWIPQLILFKLQGYLCACKCDEEVGALVRVFPYTCTLKSAQRCVDVVRAQLERVSARGNGSG